MQVNNLGSSASVSTLSWGNDAELEALQRSLPGLRPAAVLLASDVIYEIAHLDGLMRTMRALMDGSTLLLLSIEDRAPAEGWRWVGPWVTDIVCNPVLTDSKWGAWGGGGRLGCVSLGRN